MWNQRTNTAVAPHIRWLKVGQRQQRSNADTTDYGQLKTGKTAGGHTRAFSAKVPLLLDDKGCLPL